MGLERLCAPRETTHFGIGALAERVSKFKVGLYEQLLWRCAARTGRGRAVVCRPRAAGWEYDAGTWLDGSDGRGSLEGVPAHGLHAAVSRGLVTARGREGALGPLARRGVQHVHARARRGRRRGRYDARIARELRERPRRRAGRWRRRASGQNHAESRSSSLRPAKHPCPCTAQPARSSVAPSQPPVHADSSPASCNPCGVMPPRPRKVLRGLP